MKLEALNTISGLESLDFCHQCNYAARTKQCCEMYHVHNQPETIRYTEDAAYPQNIFFILVPIRRLIGYG